MGVGEGVDDVVDVWLWEVLVDVFFVEVEEGFGLLLEGFGDGFGDGLGEGLGEGFGVGEGFGFALDVVLGLLSLSSPPLAPKLQDP